MFAIPIKKKLKSNFLVDPYAPRTPIRFWRGRPAMPAGQWFKVTTIAFWLGLTLPTFLLAETDAARAFVSMMDSVSPVLSTLASRTDFPHTTELLLAISYVAWIPVMLSTVVCNIELSAPCRPHPWRGTVFSALFCIACMMLPYLAPFLPSDAELATRTRPGIAVLLRGSPVAMTLFVGVLYWGAGLGLAIIVVIIRNFGTLHRAWRRDRDLRAAEQQTGR